MAGFLRRKSAADSKRPVQPSQPINAAPVTSTTASSVPPLFAKFATSFPQEAAKANPNSDVSRPLVSSPMPLSNGRRIEPHSHVSNISEKTSSARRNNINTKVSKEGMTRTVSETQPSLVAPHPARGPASMPQSVLASPPTRSSSRFPIDKPLPSGPPISSSEPMQGPVIDNHRITVGVNSTAITGEYTMRFVPQSKHRDEKPLPLPQPVPTPEPHIANVSQRQLPTETTQQHQPGKLDSSSSVDHSILSPRVSQMPELPTAKQQSKKKPIHPETQPPMLSSSHSDRRDLPPLPNVQPSPHRLSTHNISHSRIQSQHTRIDFFQEGNDPVKMEPEASTSTSPQAGPSKYHAHSTESTDSPLSVPAAIEGLRSNIVPGSPPDIVTQRVAAKQHLPSSFASSSVLPHASQTTELQPRRLLKKQHTHRVSPGTYINQNVLAPLSNTQKDPHGPSISDSPQPQQAYSDHRRKDNEGSKHDSEPEASTSSHRTISKKQAYSQNATSATIRRQTSIDLPNPPLENSASPSTRSRTISVPDSAAPSSLRAPLPAANKEHIGAQKVVAGPRSRTVSNGMKASAAGSGSVSGILQFRTERGKGKEKAVEVLPTEHSVPSHAAELSSDKALVVTPLQPRSLPLTPPSPVTANLPIHRYSTHTGEQERGAQLHTPAQEYTLAKVDVNPPIAAIRKSSRKSSHPLSVGSADETAVTVVPVPGQPRIFSTTAVPVPGRPRIFSMDSAVIPPPSSNNMDVNPRSRSSLHNTYSYPSPPAEYHTLYEATSTGVQDSPQSSNMLLRPKIDTESEHLFHSSTNGYGQSSNAPSYQIVTENERSFLPNTNDSGLITSPKSLKSSLRPSVMDTEDEKHQHRLTTHSENHITSPQKSNISLDPSSSAQAIVDHQTRKRHHTQTASDSPRLRKTSKSSSISRSTSNIARSLLGSPPEDSHKSLSPMQNGNHSLLPAQNDYQQVQNGHNPVLMEDEQPVVHPRTPEHVGVALDQDPFARTEGVKLIRSLSSKERPSKPMPWDDSDAKPDSRQTTNTLSSFVSPDDYRQARARRRGDKLEKEPPPDIAQLAAREDEEEPEPTYFPIARFVEVPVLLASLLAFLTFADWLALAAAQKAMRLVLGERGELREEVLERYLCTVGYTRWTWVETEPLTLSLVELNDYMRGVSMPTHQYSNFAESYLQTRALHTLDPQAKAQAENMRLLIRSTRAYTRIVLRLRVQAEAEHSHAAAAVTAESNRAGPPPASRNGFSRSSSRAPSPAASMFSHGHSTYHGHSQSSTGEVPVFHSPLFRIRRAPLLRVCVPSPDGDWLSDSSVLECESELKRAGVLHVLRPGDVVWDIAVGDEGNVGRLVWDGSYLIDLDYTYSTFGDVPRYLHTLAFPPSYFHRVIRNAGRGNDNGGNPIVHMDISPWSEEISHNLQLLQDRVRTETPQGGRHNVVRWVHRSSFTIRPPVSSTRPHHRTRTTSMTSKARVPIPRTDGLFVDPGWYGTIVVETEGTNEGLADLQDRCGLGAFPPRARGRFGRQEGRMVYRVMREKSRPGEIWIRLVSESERLM